MTLAIARQRIHVSDSNGNPIVGAKLYVYAAGTTTPLSIYSDDGLSVSMANPLTGSNASDASGLFPRVYLAAGTYKLRAETSAGVLIWQDDNIDTGLSAGTGALPISRGGTGATTAAAARANLDVPSNSELAVISTASAAATAAIAALIQPPMGYLSLISGTPVIATDVSAATAVYYMPRVGNLIPIWNGSTFTSTVFAELSLTLNSNHLASTIYDLFVINDGGTVRLVTGPAWNNSAAGSGSRGSGAGTTELSLTSGIYTNANAITARYGATTVAVSAHQATYVGSMLMDGTNGQVSCHVAFGQSRKWGIWNADNRSPIVLKVGDSTASWAYGTNAYRASNNNTANSASVFQGLAEERIGVDFRQVLNGITTTNTGNRIGIGWNVTNAASGYSGQISSPSGGSSTVYGSITALHDNVPFLGLATVTAIESSPSGASSTFNGGESNMTMVVRWRG